MTNQQVERQLQHIHSSEPRQRRKAARALGKLDEGAAVDPLLDALRQDTDVWVRRAAIQALGQLGDARAVKPLLALEDRRRAIRRARLQALDQLGGRRRWKHCSPAFRIPRQRCGVGPCVH